jgi:CrcB protein
LLTYLWIAIGSGLGGMARYGCSNLAVNWLGERHAWPATLAINVLGSFVIGLFAVLSGPGGRIGASSDMRLFVMVGICGGYTTFSSFSLQTLNLIRGGDMVGAGLNIGGSVVLCLLAVWLGFLAASGLNQMHGA